MAFTYFEWAGATAANISRTGGHTLGFFASPTSESIASATVTVYDATTNARLYRTTVRANGTAQDGGAFIRKAGGGIPYQYYLTIAGDVAIAPYTTSGQSVIIGLTVTASGGGTTSEIRVTKTVHDPPTISITSPTAGEVIDALPLGITWDAADATGIAEQHVNLRKDGEVVWRIEPSGDVRAALISAADNVVENDAAYTIELWVQNGAGIYNSVQVPFTTHWAAPPLPVVTVETDTEAMTAIVTPTAGEGTPATDHFIVARVNADGTRWAIADDVESGESVTDPLPPMGMEYSYAVTAVTEAGTTSVTTVTHTVETRAWALNFGATAGEVMTLVGNPKASYSLDQGGEAYHFADGGMGNGLPVWYGTTDRDESGTLSFDTMLWHDSDRLRELCRAYPVAWLRDPFGHRWRAHVQPKISHGIGEVWQVSINWDAVRWEEAW